MTPAQREAWLLARGWVKSEGCWRLATRKQVFQVATATAAEAVQRRIEDGASQRDTRAMPHLLEPSWTRLVK